jgi:hypothetical protein
MNNIKIHRCLKRNILPWKQKKGKKMRRNENKKNNKRRMKLKIVQSLSEMANNYTLVQTSLVNPETFHVTLV